MKYTAMVAGLAYLWTVIASAVFCLFNFRMFVFPYTQWWEGLFYVRHMLWLPKFRDIGLWPLLYFVYGFVLASLAIFLPARTLFGTPRKSRQPKLYGNSKFADTKQMAVGGIITEKR